MNKTQNKAKWTPEMGRDLAAFHNLEWWDDLTSDCLDEDPIMNETQFKPGYLVKHRYDGYKGIVVEVLPGSGLVKICWLQKGGITSVVPVSFDYLQLLSRGPNNE